MLNFLKQKFKTVMYTNLLRMGVDYTSYVIKCFVLRNTLLNFLMLFDIGITSYSLPAQERFYLQADLYMNLRS